MPAQTRNLPTTTNRQNGNQDLRIRQHRARVNENPDSNKEQGNKGIAQREQLIECAMREVRRTHHQTRSKRSEGQRQPNGFRESAAVPKTHSEQHEEEEFVVLGSAPPPAEVAAPGKRRGIL